MSSRLPSHTPGCVRVRRDRAKPASSGPHRIAFRVMGV